jgi:uncharacterized membrane protein YcaP (DUF421 family)
VTDLASTLFGDGTDLDPLPMALRATAVFALTLAMIRIAGRRSLGQHRSFDTCTIVLIGAVLSRGVVGASPFCSTMTAGATIVLLHRLVAVASLHWPWFEALVSGDKRELVKDGRRDQDAMRRGLITDRDLDEAVRKKSGDEASPLERAVLERDGSITVKVADGDAA